MELGYAITITVLAWLTSVCTIGFGVAIELIRASPNRDIQHMISVVGGLASALLWFMAAFGASSLEVTDSGVTVVNPSTAAAWLFAAFGIFMIIIVVLGTGILLNVMDLTSREMA